MEPWIEGTAWHGPDTAPQNDLAKGEQVPKALPPQGNASASGRDTAPRGDPREGRRAHDAMKPLDMREGERARNKARRLDPTEREHWPDWLVHGTPTEHPCGPDTVPREAATEGERALASVKSGHRAARVLPSKATSWACKCPFSS